MPLLGDSRCLEVGWLACPPGFSREQSGWGCQEQLPTATCASATREELGSASCVPLGDCSAPFPPAGATHLVDDSYTQEDATHFRTVGAALRAAPAGALIAIEQGTYPEDLVVSRTVKLVGRCAAKVRVVAPPNGYTGLTVNAQGVEAQGLTLANHWWGVDVRGGASLTLSQTVVEGSLDNGVMVGDPGSRLRLTGSVVRGTKPYQSPSGFGVLVVKGASLEMDTTSVAANRGAGLYVSEPGTTASVSRSVVRDTQVDLDGLFGYGITVTRGAKLSLASSAVLTSHRAGLNLQHAGTSAVVSETVVRGTLPDNRRAYGVGISVVGGAKLELSRSQLTETAGPGIVTVDLGTDAKLRDSVMLDNLVDREGFFGDGAYAFGGSKLSLDRCALVRNHSAGVFAGDANTVLTLTRSLIRDSRNTPQPEATMGMGAAALGGATVRLFESAVVDNLHSAVFLLYGGKAEATGSLLLDTRPVGAEKLLGHGVFLQEGSSADLTSTVVQGSEGIGLVASDSAAALRACYLGFNEVGVHVQDGSTLSELDVVPASVAPREVAVSSDTVFAGNRVRVGSGTLALPPPPNFGNR
ncbi:MAG: right-handed parallel beta-helix repeat-containing protein [Myxococcales bacterium]|nr:right-handed parallel beta-helix repeat-containing protein [Myxococcales bacterium]